MTDYYSPLKQNYSDRYDDKPREDIVAFIEDIPEKVLEIGCGTGATGKLIKQKMPKVIYTGIEIDETAANMARERIDNVITGNVEDIDLSSFGLANQSFDLIICADVLEHLYDPWKVLNILLGYLKPDGSIVASIPNVQNISLIKLLMDGNWTYSQYGLLDSTHIRFFTWREIEKLFQGVGFHITKFSSLLQRDVDAEAWPQDIDMGNFVVKEVTRNEAIMLFTFQYLILAKKDNG
jgi:2-polyprenyl-3-methyl-5-hydroxy-6-metoxy-1,4-benzoquinol methylase